MFVFLDNETGGLGLETSLLTSCFIFTDNEFNIIDELDLKLRPNDYIYRVNAGGLAVNKINLVEHDRVAMTYSEGGQLLHKMLKQYSKDGKDKLTPAGHGIYFDLTHIWDKLYGKNNWNQFCSYRVMDTSSIGQFLILTGRLPSNLTGSLESYSQYFGLCETQEHAAKADCILSINVLKKFKEIM